MSPLGQRFFGLTSVSKIDLFLREIQILMKMYPSMSFWDAYILPIPIRRWILEEYNRQTEEDNARQTKSNNVRDTNRPLTDFEKSIVKAKTQSASNDGFMAGMRNK